MGRLEEHAEKRSCINARIQLSFDFNRPFFLSKESQVSSQKDHSSKNGNCLKL